MGTQLDSMEFFPLLLALLIGVVVGLLGGGGSILTVPLLIYLVRLEPRLAIATSLAVVAVSSLAGLIRHTRAGDVDWRSGAMVGAPAMAGAFAGGLLAAFVPPQALMSLFAILMIWMALVLLRRRAASSPRSASGEPATVNLPALKAIAIGLGTGFLTGMVGAGGGFIIVPVLAVLGRLEMRRAVGTSLLVLLMNSSVGFATHLTHVRIDWTVTGLVASASAIGAFFGAGLASRMPQPALRRTFAWVILILATVVLYRQLPLG